MLRLKKSVEELNRLSTSAYAQQQKLHITLLLDNVRSMNNVGSIFRTADCFLIEKIILAGITPRPPHRDIQKTALGATESVPWEYTSIATDAIKTYRTLGYKILSIEQAHTSISLHDFQPLIHEKYLVVLGNEVEGVQENILALSDSIIELPQFGSKHSFNVSVTAGIVLWELSKDMQSVTNF